MEEIKKKNLKVEVLLSCMNQIDLKIAEKINVNTDLLIINQTNKNNYCEIEKNGNLYRMISSTQRGLSKSRNELLLNMKGDIGIFCDDDVIYRDNYKSVILTAFKKLKDADIIIFNVDSIGRKMFQIKKIRETPFYKNYSSVRIAFKKESLKEKNIFFNLNFGTGGIYSSGEEALLLLEAKRKKLKIYEYPETILTVDCRKSSWFNGYDNKYFFDKGAWLKEAYPILNIIYKWYFIFKFKNLKIKKILDLGIKNYKKRISYEEIKNKRRNK